jgi:hypothetical protein
MCSGGLNDAFDLKINAVFNACMEATETRRIIEQAGGDTAFAKLLGIDSQRGYQQRVNNWKRRGIPAEVVLEHYETIRKLRDAVH